MSAKSNQDLLRLVYAGAALLLVFSVWSEVDLRVSGFFRFGTDHFLLAHDPMLATLRQIVWTGGLAVVAFCAVAATLRQVSRGAAGIRLSCPMLRATGFFVLGPGLIVNGALKNGWGRARPADIAEFGGDGAFTQAFHMVGTCTRNCSFVSGEAALAMAVALVLWQVAGRAGLAGPRLAATLAVFVTVTSLMRVATGRHFLSDVIFACLFMAMLARVMLHKTKPAKSAVQITPVSGMAATVER